MFDTPGVYNFRSSSIKGVKSVQGIVLVFDVTKKSTFNSLNGWLNDIKENLNNPCLVLFGNKKDIDKEKWEVTTEEAKNFAKSKNLPYFETSSKTKQGLNEGISYIVNETYKSVLEKLNTKIELGEHADEKSKCVGKNNKNSNGKQKKKK